MEQQKKREKGKKIRKNTPQQNENETRIRPAEERIKDLPVGQRV